MQAHSLSCRAASSYGFEPVGLAHDAGNLLNALGLYCDLLEGPEVLKAEHRHYAVELRGIARRSAELLGKLVAPEPFVFAGGVQQLADLEPILRAICGTECRFDLQIAEALPAVSLGVEALERIVVNLVRNAAEAIARHRVSGGEVRVSLAGDRGDLLLTVQDNGPGMDVWTAAKFVRPSAKAVAGMRGVGHRILYDLAQQTGAGFEMRVRPGRGSRFCFRWKSTGSGGVQPTC